MEIDAATAPDEFQMELLDLQSEVEFTSAFKTTHLLDFWSRVPEGKYPCLIANAQKNASVFGSTYVCEALFSKLVCIKTKYRNRLTDEHVNQLLRTASSSMSPRFDKMIESRKQNQV